MEHPKERLGQLYEWLERLPISKTRMHSGRDFRDAVVLSEIIHCYKPHWVDLHNYTPCNARQQKENNWRLLSARVLQRRFGIYLTDIEIQRLVEGDQNVVESLLYVIKQKLEAHDNNELPRIPRIMSHQFPRKQCPSTFCSYPSSISQYLLSQPTGTIRSFTVSPRRQRNITSARNNHRDAVSPVSRFFATQTAISTKRISDVHNVESELSSNQFEDRAVSNLWESVLSPQDFYEWQLLKRDDITGKHFLQNKDNVLSSRESNAQYHVENLLKQIELQREKINSLEDLVKLKDIKLQTYLCMSS